jgi:hypothetical protein
MAWPVAFEFGSWCLAAIAMTLAPRTERRWTLLLASCLVAMAAGALTRLANPSGWTLGKVDPAALVAASAAAALIAMSFELGAWRSRRLRSRSTT